MILSCDLSFGHRCTGTVNLHAFCYLPKCNVGNTSCCSSPILTHGETSALCQVFVTVPMKRAGVIKINLIT